MFDSLRKPDAGPVAPRPDIDPPPRPLSVATWGLEAQLGPLVDRAIDRAAPELRRAIVVSVVVATAVGAILATVGLAVAMSVLATVTG